MNPNYSPASFATTKQLANTNECLFDLSLDGPILRPALFGSCTNIPHKSKYHSFVGEFNCGRRSITAYRKYLWNSLFLLDM